MSDFTNVGVNTPSPTAASALTTSDCFPSTFEVINPAAAAPTATPAIVVIRFPGLIAPTELRRRRLVVLRIFLRFAIVAIFIV
jgi:hypothetical protein